MSEKKNSKLASEENENEVIELDASDLAEAETSASEVESDDSAEGPACSEMAGSEAESASEIENDPEMPGYSEIPSYIDKLNRIVEGAIFASHEPLSIAKILDLFEEREKPEKEQIEQALKQIQETCGDRGYELVEVSSGWRFQVCGDLAPWVNKLWEEKPQKYSRALLETLALIAYRQPITRGDIEEVRGVSVSSYIIKTLMEREWVKVVGHRDVPGRPSLYATTRQFLDYFALKSLEDLPSLGELKDIDSLNESLGFVEELEKAGVDVKELTEAEDSDSSEVASSEQENSSEEEPADQNGVASQGEPTEQDSEVIDTGVVDNLDVEVIHEEYAPNELIDKEIQDESLFLEQDTDAKQGIDTDVAVELEPSETKHDTDADVVLEVEPSGN